MPDLIVLCGGRGTRMGALTVQTPKPLLPVGTRPFLYHLVTRMRQQGIGRVVLAAHYLAEQFQRFCSQYGQELSPMEVVIEPSPLGTGGALRFAVERVHSEVFVAMNGDTWVSQPIVPVLEEHIRENHACTAVAVQASQVEGGAVRKGEWRVSSANAVTGFATHEAIRDGWVNAGLYVFNRGLVDSWPRGAYSLEEQFPSLLAGYTAGVFRSSARLLDIGTPACYARAGELMESTMTSPAETA